MITLPVPSPCRKMDERVVLRLLKFASSQPGTIHNVYASYVEMIFYLSSPMAMPEGVFSVGAELLTPRTM